MADIPEAPPPYRNTDAAPFVYFDLAPNYGVMAGAIQIELAARTLTPGADGSTLIEFMTVGRLRCSPSAAMHLQDALKKSLEMIDAQTAGAPAGTAVN